MKAKFAAVLLALTLLLSSGISALAEPVQIAIFHTNDVLGQVEPGNGGMGYAMAAGFVQLMRNAGVHSMLFDVGDTFSGSDFADASQGESIAKLLNAMGYTAMTPGDRDYAYGADRLIALGEMLNFPILANNLVDSEGNRPFLSHLIVDAGGVRIGVIGVSSPALANAIDPTRIEGYTFTDGIEAVEDAVDALDNITDAIIVLSHWGREGVKAPSDLLAQIEGVDLVIDGHSQESYPQGQSIEGGCMVVSAGKNLENLGIVLMTIDEGKVVDLSPTLFPAPIVQASGEVNELIQEIKHGQAENE